MNKEMRKAQEAINNEVIAFMQENNDEIYGYKGLPIRLRYCTAEVYETANLYVLRSYNTIIAAIDKRTDTLYDFLRYVYGFTSTSAQHIAKFRHDYGAGKWGVSYEKRYYHI